MPQGCADYAAAVTALGPEAWIRFEDSSGSATHVDSTGNAHTVTYASGTSSRADTGCGCGFGGKFDSSRWGRMALNPTAFGPGSTYTVVVWLKLGAGAVNRVLGNTDDNGTFSTYALLLTIYGVPYFYSGSQVDANAMHGVAVDDGGWHMVAYSRQDGAPATQRMWIDDIFAGSRSEVSVPVTPALATWSVGANERYGALYGAAYNGSLDELAVFDRVLSDAEIASLWLNGRCPTRQGWHVGRVVW